MGILADLTENCHRVSQCGVLLQLCGILFPYKWRADFLPLSVTVPIKVVLLGIGFGLFHTFAATTILRRDSGRYFDIGVFLSPASIGIALVLLKPILGYYLIPLLLFAAAMPDRCKAYGLSLPRKKEKKYPPLALLGVLGLLAAFALQTLSLPRLDSVSPKQTLIFLAVALAPALGKTVGSFFSDHLGAWCVALAFPIGGLLLFKGGSSTNLIAGIILCSSSLPILIRLVADFLPSAPGFAYGLCACLSFPMAWLAAREQISLPALTPVFGGVCAAIAVSAVALLCKRFGTIPTWVLKKIEKRTEGSKGEDNE